MGVFGLFFGTLLFLLGLLVSAAILRWAFRINDIIDRLDSILNALRAGLSLEETKRKL